MQRLFTGLALPETATVPLSLLRGGVEGARWVDPADYHVTLRFIGDVENRMADDLAEALAEIDSPPLRLTIEGPGTFGGDKPHSLHMRIVASDGLKALQAAHERVCRRAGLAPCTRKFQPHVTLAWLKRADFSMVDGFLRDHGALSWPPVEIDQFVLYSARASKGGGPYVVEAAYDLV